MVQGDSIDHDGLDNTDANIVQLDTFERLQLNIQQVFERKYLFRVVNF